MPQGNLYETNLRWPDAARETADPLSPHHFLDWDKPLSQQSPYVQRVLAERGYSVDGQAVGAYDDALLAALNGSDAPLPKQPLDLSGHQIYRRMHEDAIRQGKPEPAAVKEAQMVRGLNAAGIPGVRYKDAGSRSNFRVQTSYKGEPYREPVSFMTEQQALDYAKEQKEKGFGADVMPGTSNYVLFSDELADILKRNDEQLKAIGGYATKSVNEEV